MLYQENLFVRVSSTNFGFGRIMNMKGIPFVLEGRKASTSKHCAMSVEFDHLNTAMRSKSQEDKSCYVIASEDLELLCQSLLIQDTIIGKVFQRHEFKIIIYRMLDDMLSKVPAQNSPQRRLLEPFTVLHGVPHIKIVGPANTEYCASITAQVSRMGPTIGQCFKNVIELTNKGHEHLNQNDLEGAIEVYKMAFSQLVSTCLRSRYADGRGLAPHPILHNAVVDADLILLSNLAFLHYRLDRLGDAHFWACEATKFDPSSGWMQHDNYFAKLVYLKAIASTRLGKHQQAVEELCEGLRLVVREAYKDKRLLAMRREARHEIKGLGGIRLLKAMGIGRL